MSDKGPTESDPYICLLFNCPDVFFNTYCQKDLHYNKIKGLDLITGLFVECDKKLQLDEKVYNTTLNDILNMDNNKLEEFLNARIKYTKTIEDLLTSVFEQFESISESLVNILIKSVKDNRIGKLKKENLEAYEKINKKYKIIETNTTDEYSFLEYEDFVIILSRIINNFTGLSLKLSFTDLPNSYILSVYGNEEVFSKLAEKNEYELQLKNYASKYQKILEESKTQKNMLRTSENQKINLIESEKIEGNYGNEWVPLKYSNLEIGNAICFSPYQKYENEKDEKFQRYGKNDEYHECNVSYEGDEICDKGCSKFRNIDKLRLIYDNLDYIIKMNYLVQSKVLNYILFKRNYIDYGDKLSTKNLVFNQWNIFKRSTNMDYLYTVRNFYGEEIAYYFFWLLELTKWLFFPAIVGIIVNYSNKWITNKDGSHNAKILLFLSAILVIWGCAFLDHWLQIEKLFNYFWGTEHFQQSMPDSESFVPDGYVSLVFNKKFPYVSYWKQVMKRTVSFLVLLLMLIIIVFLVYLIFFYKVILIEKYPKYATAIGILMAILNTIEIQVMSVLYVNIAHYFNEWENHRKDYMKTNALALKLIMYDFVNNYYSMFYIAFIKKTTIFGKAKEQCYGFGGNDSCLEEIEIQLYTTIFISILLNIWEIGFPIITKGARMVSLQQKMSQIKLGITSTISPHSLEQQMLLDDYPTLIYEYSEVITYIGFVFLFSVVAPLVPFLVLILLYAEKMFDTYKLFFLERVKMIEECNGLQIYNTIIHVYIYIGLITNPSFLIFGDNYFMPEKSFYYKIILYCVFVFVLFIVTLFVKWNILPFWFEYLQDIKELYYKKYYIRDARNLPHLYLLNKERSKKNKKANIPLQIKIKSE